LPSPSDRSPAAPLTRTAVLAFAAAKAALKKTEKERQSYYEEIGLDIHDRNVYRALELRRKPAGRQAPADPDLREWAWEMPEVDAGKLGLEKVLAWMPRPASPAARGDQADLVRALRSTPGIIRLQECFDDTVVIEAIVADPLDKRRLQAQLREICPDVLWGEVRQEDQRQAARGWAGVARQVAAAEGRLSDPGSNVQAGDAPGQAA